MVLRVFKTGILLLLLAFTASAQSALQFMVSDKNNGQPVPFAYVNVYVNNSLKNTVQTNEDGFASVKPEVYPCTIKIIIAGYDSYVLPYDTAPAVSTPVAVAIQKNFSTLNEVVVTGLAQPTKLRDALSSYQVIPRSMIQAQGSVTLNEVLSKQLNMNVGNDDILGSNIRMQGMGGDKVKILLDGMPVNGRENGNINLSQISMNNVERIEIIQGPMSVVYGTDAIGGVINVITRQDRKPLAIHVGGYASSVDKYNADASLTFAINKRSQLAIGGGRNFFKGWMNIDSAKGYHGDTINTNRCFLFKPNEQYIGNVSYNYVASSHFKFNFASDFLKDKITARGSLRSWDPFTGAYATDNYFYTDRLITRIGAQGDLGASGHWMSQNSLAYYHRVHNTVNKDLVSLEENLTTNPGDQDTTVSLDYSFRGAYSNHVGKLKYTAGYDVNMEFFNSLKLEGRSNSVQDYALYADLSYPLVADMLTVNAGIRGAYNTKYDPPVIPAFNLLYTPLKNLQVRASYAQGYRAPSLKEMYLNFQDVNHNITGNDTLRPENSKQMQLSASYQVVQQQANYLQFIVTEYYNDIYNQIILAKFNTNPNDNRYQYANLNRLRNIITNVQADGQYERFHGTVGFAYAHNYKVSSNYDAFNATEVNATLQYAWRKAGLNFNVFYKLTGAQPFLFIDITGEAYFNGRQSAFSVCDASVEKKFLDKRLQIVVGVKNVFDIRSPQVTGGMVTTSAHGSMGGSGNLLPRSLFASVNINID